ncbi:CCA tRNA nucleotidyltransferase, mitochondrial [Saxophila tyrrhenica]|uniref:CCA tRNA nucleotidyltransferase, mitochondrial n=1 Tax=Saxophila tyrrhenica TaxID=1690608 RepID=A0AAV9NYR2_9PEZI|nr:CCA tRNA nucleotidyltransferase, mitochondrial [Saxophila tyrrhenica]
MAPALIQEVEDDETTSPSKELELTPVEATLRTLLLDVAKYIDENPNSPDPENQVKLPPELANEKIVLRFTGGWVRDKLLGVPSHDIDLAINKMTGYQFGLRLKEYLEIPGNPEKYGLEGVATTDKQNQKAGSADKSKVVGGLHKIEANPEKSKHLETVTTKIMGLDIDLVNLRKETYTDDSRNPAMEFGTPEEDALRRDATVNAMFYNINTTQIEDFTGRGHDDMKAKIIRTPLEPYQTFKDDPLRVLRLIRFASRLGYKIDAKALKAMRDSEIKDALRRKISRERVGIELEKALRGPDPHEAMRLIYSLDLYDTIFSDPTIEPEDAYTPETRGWQAVIDCLRDTLNGESVMPEVLVKDNEDRFLAWQIAAMVPYNDAPQPEPPEPGRKAPPPIAAQVAREGIKSTNKVCDIIASSLRHQSEISEVVHQCYQHRRRQMRDMVDQNSAAAARDTLGMAIRGWGSSWRTQATYAMLVEVAQETSDAEAIEKKYQTFTLHLQQLGILEAHTFKPLLDGKALAKALNTSPGPWMKDALDVVMAYQLRNPDTASSKDAIEEVQQHLQHEKSKQNGGELSSSFLHHFLKLTIRPLFLKTKPTSVTDTGRKNTTTVLPKKMTNESFDDSVTRPWKNDPYALDQLRWCVAALDTKEVEGVWHLLIPPLLTLVDDWEVRYKTLGVKLVQQVLLVTPPALLKKTGLGEVFEEALMPCLTYIPTLTPEEDSVKLLGEAYPALLTLSRLRFPEPASTAPAAPTPLPSQPPHDLRTKSLDRLLRSGPLHTFSLCPAPTFPRLAARLYRHTSLILRDLGIESVKHLKYVLPTLTATLTHPLAAPGEERWRVVMLEALRCLRVVVLMGWARMGVWRGEVLRGVTGAWIRVVDVERKTGGGEEGLEGLKKEIREVVEVLRCAVLGQGVEWEREWGVLVEVEPKLKGLFEGMGDEEGRAA